MGLKKKRKNARIESFSLQPDTRIADKYHIVHKLGAGWEGEVYKIAECKTGIERAAKLFYPHRNPYNRTSRFYARKLHKLRQCPILIQYHTEEQFAYHDVAVTALISEYVEGELLARFLKRFPGKRLTSFQGIHLLYALVKGIEPIHLRNEYHGDLHTENIIVNRFGLEFDLKLVDMFHWQASKAANRQDDICDLIKILYDAVGGARHYARQPAAVKYLCCGLKRSLILTKFRTATQLRKHLETLRW